MKTRIRRFSETVKIRSSVFNRLRSHKYFSLSLLITVVLAASCIHIWQRVVVLDLVADVSHLRSENASLIDATRKVHSDITALSSSARIEQYASDSLGLETISAERLYTLVGERRDAPEPSDEMATVLAAVKRVAAHIPSVTRSSASAGELPRTTIDSLTEKGADK
ncbi:MAG: cell division protein FtsL [candidate division Zixibacteria bacterium]|nr:cell division protein FtsL [candidate division Zixibacteria bacterium]